MGTRLKKYLLIITCSLFSQAIVSQNEPKETDNDIIEFNDGSTKEGEIKLNGIERPRKNGTVKLCDENYKNCKNILF